MDGVPVFKVVIDSKSDGLNLVSMVASPAMEAEFLALSKQGNSTKLAQDEMKQVLTGALIIPDKPILRMNDQGEDPFYIVFSKADIEEIRDKFFRDGNIDLTNHEHSDPLKGNHIVESWLVEDSAIDKSVALDLGEYPKGTLMVSYKINDDDYWNDEVLTGNVKGFSLEGVFSHEKIKFKSKKDTQMTTTTTKKKFSVRDAFLRLYKMLNVKLAIMNLVDGTTIEWDEETNEVFILDDEGNRTDPLADGDYETEDGVKFTVKDGQYTIDRDDDDDDGEEEDEMEKLKKENADLKAKLKDELSDDDDDGDEVEGADHKDKDKDKDKKKTKLSTTIRDISVWDIEVDADEITFGTQLKMTNEEGEGVWTLADGEYELEDGTKLQVDSTGKVIMIDGKTEDGGTTATTESSEELTKLSKENGELKESIDKLSGQVAKLSENAGIPAEEDEGADDGAGDGGAGDGRARSKMAQRAIEISRPG